MLGWFRTTCLGLTCTVIFYACSVAFAQKLPLWEAGLGVAPITFPDYRGADEQSNYVLPLPYFVYRGERLQVDRNGPRGILFDTKRLQLDLSLNASIPVESDDNEARRGMPDIDPTLEIGPVLKYYLTDEDAPLASRLKLPVRGHRHRFQLARLRRLDGIARIVVGGPRGSGRMGLKPRYRPIFADASYHDHFYGVASEFAAPQRPAYGGEGGYSGAIILFGGTRRYRKFWLGAFVRYDNLSGTAFEDSPLFKSEHALSAGFGVA
jgi:outer membrane scaffolding protein for murein synthesis (MipA/OmpV family)